MKDNLKDTQMVEKEVQPGEKLLKQLASIKEHLLKILERAKEA